MSVPINRGTDGVSRNVYALIFNGITRASAEKDGFDSWLPLSERERFTEAVYAELAAGGIEFRLGGLTLLAQVAGPPPSCCNMHNEHCEPPSELCCHSCPEADHPQHPAGVWCVLDSAPPLWSEADRD